MAAEELPLKELNELIEAGLSGINTQSFTLPASSQWGNDNAANEKMAEHWGTTSSLLPCKTSRSSLLKRGFIFGNAHCMIAGVYCAISSGMSRSVTPQDCLTCHAFRYFQFTWGLNDVARLSSFHKLLKAVCDVRRDTGIVAHFCFWKAYFMYSFTEGLFCT